MIDLLSLQPASIQQLAKRVGMSLPAINRHITVLEQSGLVQRKKSGRTNFLALDRAAMRQFQAWAMRFDAAWEPTPRPWRTTWPASALPKPGD
jgi:DNA-binding IclR family transcriptional regulator